ncbi:uncharacterized protein LOC124616583 [Schistocerca americana]|uniref:uncharacterized protein LOC124616583 n=1 Tax=Schistocerca americana TaxID=7009 RepID=UPI001F4F66BB|nr:uncharacterized protein LOC124616583 [Schistocerca americana]
MEDERKREEAASQRRGAAQCRRWMGAVGHLPVRAVPRGRLPNQYAIIGERRPPAADGWSNLGPTGQMDGAAPHPQPVRTGRLCCAPSSTCSRSCESGAKARAAPVSSSPGVSHPLPVGWMWLEIFAARYPRRRFPSSQPPQWRWGPPYEATPALLPGVQGRAGAAAAAAAAAAATVRPGGGRDPASDYVRKSNNAALRRRRRPRAPLADLRGRRRARSDGRPEATLAGGGRIDSGRGRRPKGKEEEEEEEEEERRKNTGRKKSAAREHTHTEERAVTTLRPCG